MNNVHPLAFSPHKPAPAPINAGPDRMSMGQYHRAVTFLVEQKARHGWESPGDLPELSPSTIFEIFSLKPHSMAVAFREKMSMAELYGCAEMHRADQDALLHALGCQTLDVLEQSARLVLWRDVLDREARLNAAVGA